jgi:hypothetical protein
VNNPGVNRKSEMTICCKRKLALTSLLALVLATASAQKIKVSGEIFAARLHVGRNRRRRAHRFLDYHRVCSALFAPGQCPVRYRCGEVLQDLHRLDDPARPEIEVK